MSLISKLFGKEKPKASIPVQATRFAEVVDSKKQPSLHFRGKPDENGLYPSELVMLSVAEKYKISETQFPEYLTYAYEIANPLKMLKDLQARGFITVGGPKSVLFLLKLPELKEIASSLCVPCRGKKADIVAQLSAVDEEKLSEFVNERAWKLTDRGQSAISANPYIQYFLDKHDYNVSEVGVDIWSVNEAFVKNPTHPFRDIIYKQLNDKMNAASLAIQTNSNSWSENARLYCECYRMMGLFVEEEKSYANAADLYFQYLYKRINIEAGLRLLLNYRLFKGDKKNQEFTINRYYDEIRLYPYQKVEILRLIDELNISDESVHNALISSFERAGDTGVMSPRDAADFIVFELSGDVDKSRDLSVSLAKKAVKRMK